MKKPVPPHPSAIPNYYADRSLDRAGHLRRDDNWLRERLADREKTRIVPIWRSRALVIEQDAPMTVLLPPMEELIEAADSVAFLGVIDGVAHFVVDLSQHDEPPLRDQGEFTDLRQVGARMNHAEGSMLAYARAITTWHRRHRFCGVCGSPTESRDAGHVRKCVNPDCGTSCFPRTDPAVIMLIHDGGDRVILGRKSAMPLGQHSILAGFVEPGESLEDAVAREVFEEVGVRIDDIHYHSSQPWPFPANIMLGFNARATTFDITVDYNELEDGARWFTRDELLNSPEDGSFRLPRPDSISRRLIREWLEDG